MLTTPHFADAQSHGNNIIVDVVEGKVRSSEVYRQIGSWQVGSSLDRIFRTPEASASFFEQTVQAGLQCLDRLGTADSKENARKLRDIRAKGNVKLFCGDEIIPGHGGQADFACQRIFMSNNRLAGYNSQDLEKSRDARALVFHEFIHLLGHSHGEYEYAYTCEACCFPKGTDGPEMTKTACSLCAGEGKKLSEDQYLDKLMTLSTSYMVESPVALTLRNRILAEGATKNISSVKKLYDVMVDSTNIPKSLAYGDVFSQKFQSPVFRNKGHEAIRDREVMSGIFYNYYKGLAEIESSYIQGDFLGAALRMQEFVKIDLPTHPPRELMTPASAEPVSRMFPMMRDDVKFSAVDLGARIEDRLKEMGATQKAAEIHRIFYD